MDEGSHQKAEVETTDRPCFDFFKKKDDGKCAAMEESSVKEKEENKGEQLIHHSDSGPISLDILSRTNLKGITLETLQGSDEEMVGERKRKKKGLKDKIMGKIAGEKKGDHDGCNVVPNEPEESTNEVADAPSPEAKRSFLEKFKDKLPGQHKKTEDTTSGNCVENEHNEKKGILEKIKEKIPGSNHKAEEEKKKD